MQDDYNEEIQMSKCLSKSEKTKDAKIASVETSYRKIKEVYGEAK